MKLHGSHAHRPPYDDLAFFAGWTSEDLKRLQRLVEVVDYEPGEFVTWRGQLAAEFLVIASGRAAVLENDEPVAYLTEGDTIGEVAMLEGTTSSVDVVAQTYLRALLLGAREFNGLLSEAPSMGRRLAMLLAGRLRHQPAA